ncbi:hypothetical protein MRX96_005282 [Rhipicephalus microplus]
MTCLSAAVQEDGDFTSTVSTAGEAGTGTDLEGGHGVTADSLDSTGRIEPYSDQEEFDEGKIVLHPRLHRGDLDDDSGINNGTRGLEDELEDGLDEEDDDEGLSQRRKAAGRGRDKVLDFDEEKRYPQYIPKKGAFYQHDDRVVGDEDSSEVPEEKTEDDKGSCRPKKLWHEECVWEHDMYREEEQGPKSSEELVRIYGYDIRSEPMPPRARRWRRYGRGPNKYERSWKDEDASTPQSRSGRSGGARGGRRTRGGSLVENRRFHDEDFPDLHSKPSENTATMQLNRAEVNSSARPAGFKGSDLTGSNSSQQEKWDNTVKGSGMTHWGWGKRPSLPPSAVPDAPPKQQDCDVKEDASLGHRVGRPASQSPVMTVEAPQVSPTAGKSRAIQHLLSKHDQSKKEYEALKKFAAKGELQDEFDLDGVRACLVSWRDAVFENTLRRCKFQLVRAESCFVRDQRGVFHFGVVGLYTGRCRWLHLLLLGLGTYSVIFSLRLQLYIDHRRMETSQVPCLQLVRGGTGTYLEGGHGVTADSLDSTGRIEPYSDQEDFDGKIVLHPRSHRSDLDDDSGINNGTCGLEDELQDGLDKEDDDEDCLKGERQQDEGKFAKHYRKFIPEFAKVTHKLRHLLAKDAPFVWTDAHEATVNAIKHALKNPLILASFRPDCPTNVHVDASQTGQGAVLSETQDGKKRIIEYASRSRNEHDHGLHSNMLECMALYWAITEKFSVYLRGGPRFTVFTDIFSLSYLVQKGASNRRFARWMLDLAEYTFDVKHKPGRQNSTADALSRQSESAEAFDQGVSTRDLHCYAVVVDKHSRLREFQERDTDCKRFREEAKHKSSDYEIENDILVKKSIEGGRVRRRVIIPAALRSSVMIVFHDNNGHIGVEETRDLIQRKYWWPLMRKDIREYVDSCHTCQTINARTTRNEGCLILCDIPTEPNAVISLDHMGLLNEKGDYILVCIDHATRYMDAVTVPSTSSTHYLDFMTNRWIPRFGVPSVIIKDQAKGFVNKKTNQFHRRLGIAHQNSPPYWPQSNGLIERMENVDPSDLQDKVLDFDEDKRYPQYIPEERTRGGSLVENCRFHDEDFPDLHSKPSENTATMQLNRAEVKSSARPAGFKGSDLTGSNSSQQEKWDNTVKGSGMTHWGWGKRPSLPPRAVPDASPKQQDYDVKENVPLGHRVRQACTTVTSDGC